MRGRPDEALAAGRAARNATRDPDRLVEVAAELGLCSREVLGDGPPCAERLAAARPCADEAMIALRKAVANGYRDAGRLRKDEAFDPLRGREDFRALLRQAETVRP